MKAKQIFFIMAAVVLSLTGCGKQEKEEGNTVTEYFKEAPVTMPEDIVGCLDFQYGEDGEYQACLLYTSCICRNPSDQQLG